MTRRRDVLAGITAIAAGVGITAAGASAAQQPEKALHVAIARYLVATEDREATRQASEAALARATARYPEPLPKWQVWARANHPSGEFDPFGDRAPLTQQAMADLEGHLARPAEAGASDENDPETIRLQRAVFAASDADAAAYYAEVGPAYDRLIAERKLAIAAIDAAENVRDLDEVDDAAYDRRSDAYHALLACRPTTWATFAVKAQALLQTPWPSDGEIDPDERDALLADIAALTAEGAA